LTFLYPKADERRVAAGALARVQSERKGEAVTTSLILHIVCKALQVIRVEVRVSDFMYYFH